LLTEEEANADGANPVDSDSTDDDCDEQPGRTKFSFIASVTRSTLRRSSSTSSICVATTTSKNSVCSHDVQRIYSSLRSHCPN